MLNFSLLPVSHWIFLPICWLSFLIYIRLLYIIYSGRRREFNSSYFQIVRLHAITDITLFLYVELLARPRKYHITDILIPGGAEWLPQLCYFFQTWKKNVIFMGYTVVALNRWSVIVLERKIWRPFSFFLLEWLLPLLFLIPLFYLSGPYHFAFTESPSHLILLRATQEFMKLDALQDFLLSTMCFLISSLLYFITFGHLIRQLQSSPFISSISISNLQTEVIILKCAFVSFILFIPNFIKTTVLYFATDPEIVNIGTELWFFTTELMCISSPWSLLISSRSLRNQFVPERFRGGNAVKNAVSINKKRTLENPS